MSCPRNFYLVTALVLLVTACAPLVHETPQQPPPAAAQEPANFPRAGYEQAAALGHAVYRVDSTYSLVTMTVRRGGSLARLGHDHLIASHTLQGLIDVQASRADLYMALDELVVDEPALRAEAGLDTQPSAADIAGTRSKMLEHVLETRQFPFALIQVSAIEKTATGWSLSAAITLHGVRREFELPVQMETSPEGMRVSGGFELRQSDFGITPFSILGGAIRVQDWISLRFTVASSVWHRSEAPGLWPGH
jgi:hypothetical protein